MKKLLDGDFHWTKGHPFLPKAVVNTGFVVSHYNSGNKAVSGSHITFYLFKWRITRYHLVIFTDWGPFTKVVWEKKRLG